MEPKVGVKLFHHCQHAFCPAILVIMMCLIHRAKGVLQGLIILQNSLYGPMANCPAGWTEGLHISTPSTEELLSVVEQLHVFWTQQDEFTKLNAEVFVGHVVDTDKIDIVIMEG